MQNKPNFRDTQMNVYPLLTMAYENKFNWTLGQNKPNSNPIKPNFRKAKMNVNSLITKDYRKKDDFAVQQNKPNSNPISVKPKMNVNIFGTKDYENETTLRPQKNKPNSNPISKQLVGARPRWPESAKMAQIVANRGFITVQAESIKKPLKKHNLLNIKMLSCSHRPIPTTGTSFAHLEYMR